ncbi:MAG TPA: cytochrome C [Chromatiales bacterium]|nr:cytochrome C [Chromatiales bacterium]
MFTAAAGALALAAFLQPAAAAGANKADGAKIKSYVESNGLSCLGCHAIGHKLVGPAWMAVAKKYKGKAGASAELAKRIANGGSGVWGPVPMPPGQATPAQAKQLAKMVLDLYTK